MPSQDDSNPIKMKENPRGFVNQSEVRNITKRESSSKKDFHSVKTLTNKQSSKLTYDMLAPKDLDRDLEELNKEEEEEPYQEFNIMKTTLNTIELRSDHFDGTTGKKSPPHSPGKSPRKGHGGKRLAPQPIKRKNKMVSPQKKQEKALKEQKQ